MINHRYFTGRVIILFGVFIPPAIPGGVILRIFKNMVGTAHFLLRLKKLDNTQLLPLICGC